SSQGLRWGGQAQIDFDNQRHAAIGRLVKDMQRGERRVVPLMRPLAGTHPCASDEVPHDNGCVGELSLNWGQDGARNFIVQEMVEQGDERFYVLVDEADVATAADARAAAVQFASTFDKEHQLLALNGHTGTLDHNSDGAITLAFSNHTGGGVSASVVGFFDYRDMLPSADAEATGNEMDILWARPPSASVPAGLTVATLAHEYSHLASFALRVSAQGTSATQEALWLDEGIAHTIEDLTGWGPSNIDAVEATLQDWADTALAGPLDSIANRGMAYLFLRHLIDSRAKANGASSAQSSQVEDAAAEILGGMMQESTSGFEHPYLKSLSRTQHANWVLGVYATGGSYLDSTQRADFLAPGTAETGNQCGIDTHGTFTNASGDSVALDGPASDDLDDLTEIFEGEVLESGSILLLVTELEPGSHEIKASADDAITLRLQAERVE
ncbi:MAG: hypothetical protein HOK28_04775, partial [Deltaproteobacteria bacterium]|nr:hypothetical protein [Deltaproteobacteria bacterium]